MNTSSSSVPFVLSTSAGSALADDFEMLRACEENLRQYEARLRALQAELDQQAAFTGSKRRSSFPFAAPRTESKPAAADPSLEVSWDKLFRARSLLEAEQGHLKDDRLVLREEWEALKRREATIAAREARVAERESQEASAIREPEFSAVSRFTRAPFEIARSVFGTRAKAV